ncbi:MAG: sigW 2 [Actinomycetia bacterium]|nr:sigW 2 [Actinomycetes bacterium]
MRDREVAAAIVAGDPAGLAEAYNRYADPLYNFCRAILHEPADAADAVHDTFVIAACRLSGLGDPELLRSWLYAVARNECLRKLRGGSRQEPLEKIADIADKATDIAADAEQAELRALVREALNGLGPAEREVLELQIRHGLTNGESASILGISRNHLHALLSRARDQLETSLGVLAVARTGRRDCPVLDAMLEGWDGRLTILLRKRVNQHVRRCVVCSERRHREMTPAMFLGATPLIALPLAALHPAFRAQVLRAAIGHSPAAAAHRAALTHTAYTFGSRGFPRPLAPPRAPWWHPRPAYAGAAAGTAAAVVTIVTIVATPPHHAAHAAGGGPADGTAPGLIASGTGGAVPTTSAGSSDSQAGGTAGPSALPTTGGASPTTAAPTRTSPSATASTAPLSGTLSVSPATLDVVPPASGTITLTASDGPVDWSVSEPPGLARKVIVSPMSGALAAGATTTVSVIVDGPGKMHVHLVFSPGGSTVTVVIS